MDPKTGDWRIFKSDGTRRRIGLRGPADLEAANQALADELIGERLGSSAPRLTDSVPVMDLVYRYAEAKADVVAKPQLLADAIEALSPFWAGKTAAQINRTSCGEYTKWRVNGGLRKHHLKTRDSSMSKAKISPSTARRDLTTLRAAAKFAQADGILLGTMPAVVLPNETPSRDRSLTRNEAAKILRELWRGAPTKARNGSWHRSPGKTKHAARLFLLLLYTGSRFATVAKTTRKKREDGPWIDMKNEIWYRRGSHEKVTKKRREPHRIPGKIMLALERWERLFPDQVYLVEHSRNPGKPVGDIGQALDGACKRLRIERITPHGLKHTAITLYISGGGDPMLAAEYFSTTYETIKANYLHLHPNFQEDALAKVSQLGKRPERNGTKREKMAQIGTK
jgi:integrase